MRYENIAGVVTLYNPDKNVLRNLETYLFGIDMLYVVANSSIDEELVQQLECNNRVILIQNNENLGIAKALNYVLHIINDKHEWLLTMDQDTLFVQEKLNSYLQLTKIIKDRKVYGITGLFGDDIQINKTEHEMFADSCITSGMLVNVNLAKKYGGFDERLFIDEVDHEFCYRLNSRGYKLLVYPQKIIEHRIGDATKKNIFGYSFSVLNEKYYRVYYIFRNSLYVMSEYRHIRKKYIIKLIKYFFKIIFLENDKLTKIKYVKKALCDYWNGKMGKMKSE